MSFLSLLFRVWSNKMSQTNQPKYRVRFFIDWWTHWLWSGNEATTEDFRYHGLEEVLPLSESIRKRGSELMNWYVAGIYGLHPSGPDTRIDCVWRQEECDRFKVASRAFFADLQQELGPDFEVVYEQGEPDEDPDLDAYIADIENFQRLAEVTVIAIAFRRLKDNQLQLLACRDKTESPMFFPQDVIDGKQDSKTVALELVWQQTGITLFAGLREYQIRHYPATLIEVDGHPRVLRHYTKVYAVEVGAEPERRSLKLRKWFNTTGQSSYRWLSEADFDQLREDHRQYLNNFSAFINTHNHYGYLTVPRGDKEVEFQRKVYGKE